MVGEYAVVAGFPAVVISVAYRASLRAEPSPEGLSLQGIPVGVDVAPCTTVGELLAVKPFDLSYGTRKAIAETWQTIHPGRDDLPGLRVTLDTTALHATDAAGQLHKRGYGSSGLTLLLLTALWMADEPDAGTDPWRNRVLGAARRVQLSLSDEPGSGIDLVGGTFGGIRRFDPSKWASAGLDPIPERLQIAPHFSLLEIAHKKTQSTEVALRHIRSLAEGEPQSYRNIIGKMRDCEAATVQQIRSGGSLLPELLDRYGVWMALLGERSGVPIVTAAFETAREIVHRFGGGAKPSGAGGGDTSIALLPTARAEDALQALRADGLDARPLRIDDRGLSLDA